MHEAELAPGARAMPPVDGFEGPQARGNFQGCALCGVAGLALKLIGASNRGCAGNDRAYTLSRNLEPDYGLGWDVYNPSCTPSDQNLSEWAGVSAICPDRIRYTLVRAHKHMFAPQI